MMKVVLTAVPNPGLEAESVLLPERLTLRSPKVARPVELVERIVVPPRVPVPEEMERVTAMPEAVTLLPRESRIWTVTAGERGDPATAFVGCWRNTSVFGGPGMMENSLLPAAVRLPLVARNVFVSVRLMLRLLNVAMPDVVLLESVPLRIPVPVMRATVTDVPVVVSLLPKASCSATVTAGRITAPATVFVGCCINARRAAAAGFTRILLEVSRVSAPLVKRTVIVSATVCDIFEKVTIPFFAVAVSMPCSVPAPASLAAVTTVLLSVVRRFPLASSTRTIGCWAKATPAVADTEGSV